MLLFKLLGLLMILVSCTFLGVLKSLSFKKRAKKLAGICVSLSTMEQLVKAETVEFPQLIESSFESETVSMQGGMPLVNETNLNKDDIELLNTFLSKLGMSDAYSECSRIGIYKTLLEKQCSEAEAKAEQYSKLYNSLGFLTGLAICIFLI